jgi:uncharacterized membrane protein
VRVQESIEIERPLDDVFSYVSDAGNYPEWMAHALEVRKQGPGPPRKGEKFTLAIRSVGRRFETPFERTRYEPNRRCADRAIGGPVPNQWWECDFQEVPGGTRLTRTAEARGNGLLKLLEPLQKWSAGRQLRKDLQTLKGVLETRQATSGSATRALRRRRRR